MARYNFEKRTFSVAPEGIIELFIDAQYMPIYAQPYDGEQLTIEYYDSEELKYVARVENGIAILNCPDAPRASAFGGVFNMFMSQLGGVNWQKLPIDVLVPRDYAGMLNLCTTCARISARDLELRNRLHATTSNAAIDVSGAIATAFEFVTSNGKIIAENAAACGEGAANARAPLSSKAVTSNGAIELSGFSTLGALDCRSSNGAIRLRDAAIQGGLSCVTSNGGVFLDNVSVQELTYLRTSNGGVNFERLLSKDMEFISNNGAIRGSAIGAASDFAIDSRTSNGKSSLPQSSADTGRHIHARTSNANISIDFVA